MSPAKVVNHDFLKPNVSDGVGKVLVKGAKIKADIREAITSASVSMSTDSITQLTIVTVDTDLVLLKSGIFGKLTSVDYEDLKLEVTNIDVEPGPQGRGQTTVKARSLVVGKLKRRRGALVMRNSSPSDFVERECKKVGAKFHIQPSSKRGSIHRDVKHSGEVYGNNIPSSWTTFMRLADELGYDCFEIAGAIFFGQPTWLVKRDLAKVPVRWREGNQQEWAETLPNFHFSTDADDGPYSVGFTLPMGRALECRIGRLAVMTGVPYFSGKYFITEVDYPLAGPGSVEVSAKTVINPVPNPPEKKSNKDLAREGTMNASGEIIPATGNRGTKLANDMVYWALRQAGDTYIYGAETNLSDKNPDAFDCSELVQWAVAQAGGSIPDGSANQLTWCRNHGTMMTPVDGIGQRGALLFKQTSSEHHVAISLGNGRTIEAANRTYGVRTLNAKGREWTHAAFVPGLRYA